MKRLTVLLAGLIALATLGVRPVHAQESAPASEVKPIVIGLAAPFTGSNANFGFQIRMGIEQAREEINAAGGIDGRPVKIIAEDDGGTQTEANKVALKLAGNDEIMAVVGHFNSSCSLAGRGIYKNAGLVMFSPASTNATVTIDYDNVFRNIFTDAFQGRSLANLCKEKLGFTRVGIIHDADDYGRGLSEFFVERAGEIGLEIADRKAYDRETTDFRPTLTSMMKRKPQAIVIAGLYDEAAQITRQLREQGITVPILASDGVFSEIYIKNAGRASEGTLVSTPYLFDENDPRAMAFFNAVKTRTGNEPDAWAALSYDALMMIVDAIRHGATTRAAIRDHLAAIDTPEEAYDGLTGKTYFDANGDCVKDVFIAEVKDGKFVLSGGKE